VTQFHDKSPAQTRLFLIVCHHFQKLVLTPASTNSSPVITQQNFSGTSSNSSVNTSSPLTTSGNLHVYVVGAIKHPGVYLLPTGARVYLLLQDTGGPLPNADLVALNLAAPLSDGEEVYVTVIGEKPPT
jgi:competence protein ComEA